MKYFILILIAFALSVFYLKAQKPITPDLLLAIEKAKTPKEKISANIDAGDFYYQYYNALGYSKAANYYEVAREVANETKDSLLIGIAYHSLAQVYDAVGDDKLPKALEYYKIFNATTKKGVDTPRILRSIINIIATQQRLNMTNESIQLLQELTSLAKKYNQQKFINRANVFAAYICSIQKNYTLSKKYFSQINTVNDTIKNSALAYEKMYYLAKVYLLGNEKKYIEGIAAGEEGLKASTNQSDSMEIYYNLSDFAQKAGEYKKAFEYKDAELDLYSEINRDQGMAAVNNSLLKSELALKENNANLLQQKQAVQTQLNKWLIAGLILMGVAFLGIIWLVTVKRKQNIILAEQVAQNNLLLKEVHHRVKNNLQIISSFILLQQLKKNINPEELIKQLQSKIQTLALIHQKLHIQNNYDKVILQSYFEQLCKETVFTFATKEDNVICNINTNSCALDLDTLTPLALIVNELMLNSIKYVSEKQVCILDITAISKNNFLHFEYSDNGTGLPVGKDFETTKTTGLRLVKALAKQIKATVTAQLIDDKQIVTFKIPTTNTQKL
jgi:two-component system, sensor histidine kinase PdtaS